MAVSNKILIMILSVMIHYGYPLIFITSILEATPIIGFLSPGLLFVILGGLLADMGWLNVWWVFTVAFAGAVIGDTYAYYLGKRYGIKLINKAIKKFGRFEKNKKHFYNTKRMINSHAGKVLIIGRFNSVTRAFGPFAAGSTELDFRKFMTYNLVGSLLWSAAYVALGYIAGESYQVVTKYINTGSLALLLALIAIYYLYRKSRKVKKVED